MKTNKQTVVKNQVKRSAGKRKHKRPLFNFRNLVVYLFIRELINYFYIRKVIKREKKNNVWNSLNLRADYVGRIYTVLNLRKEDAGDDETVKRSKVFEKMLPINAYIKKLDLHEIVYPAVEKQSDRSYLVVYVPLLKYITFGRILKYIIVLFGLVYTLFKLPIIIAFVESMLLWF